MNEIDEAFERWATENVVSLDDDFMVSYTFRGVKYGLKSAFKAGYKAAKERPSTTITTADAARELETSPEYVQRLISSRKIEAVMVGRILNVNRESLDHYKNNRPKRGPKKKV